MAFDGYALANILIALAALIVLILYTRETSRLRRETTNILREAQRQNELALLPILCLEVVRKASSLTSFRADLKLRNLGHGVALNSATASIRTKDGRTLTFTHPLSLLSGEETDIQMLLRDATGRDLTVGSVSLLETLLNDGSFDVPVKAVVTCTSTSGSEYQTAQAMRLEAGTNRLQVLFVKHEKRP